MFQVEIQKTNVLGDEDYMTIIEPFALPSSQGKHTPRPLSGSGVS